VDELLRPVLPDRDGSPPAARQHLHEALGRQEIQAAADHQAVQAVVGRTAPTSTRPVRPLERGPLIRLRADQKSPVTGDCHAGIRGSPGVRFPRATRLDAKQPSQGALTIRPAWPLADNTGHDGPVAASRRERATRRKQGPVDVVQIRCDTWTRQRSPRQPGLRLKRQPWPRSELGDTASQQRQRGWRSPLRKQHWADIRSAREQSDGFSFAAACEPVPSEP
jgi:hypothetical protein